MRSRDLVLVPNPVLKLVTDYYLLTELVGSLTSSSPDCFLWMFLVIRFSLGVPTFSPPPRKLITVMTEMLSLLLALGLAILSS